jgi:hypothetical protein
MKLKLLVASVLFAASCIVRGEALPPEKLLPADTLAMMTAPDWDKAMTAYREFPFTKLWHDPAMKAFVEKFDEKLKSDFVEPLERELGIKFSDYNDLAHGQVTLGVMQNGWTGQKDQLPGFVLLIDTKDKGDQLKSALTKIKKQWIDSGKKIKTDTIRDVEFTTAIIEQSDLQKMLQNAFPGPKEKDNEKESEGPPLELTIGQSGSLLLLGTTPKDFEKILARQAGGLVSSLAEEPLFEANRAAMFRDSLFYAWANYRPLNEIIKRRLAEQDAPEQDNNPMKPPSTDKIFQALGVDGIKTLAAAVNQTSEGMSVDFFVGIPESNRRGLFSVILPQTKDAGPPPFVPADTAKFYRYRLDGQKLWSTLDRLFKDLSPQMWGLLKVGLESAGKDKDPNFDLEKQLFGNLGDDVIMMEKPPRSAKLADLQNPPSLTLIGSPNPEQLVGAIKMLVGMLPPQLSNFKEREFLGRKIYSLTMPPMPGADGPRSFSFSSGAGYLAMSQDVPLLEEFLRSGESSGKALSEVAGLREAAQKVGGTATGWFGYDNQVDNFRMIFAALKQDPKALQKLLPQNPLESPLERNSSKGFTEFFDYSLLPPFEKVSKYFYYSVFSANTGSDGIHLKTFAPNPPGLNR